MRQLNEVSIYYKTMEEGTVLIITYKDGTIEVRGLNDTHGRRD